MFLYKHSKVAALYLTVSRVPSKNNDYLQKISTISYLGTIAVRTTPYYVFRNSKATARIAKHLLEYCKFILLIAYRFSLLNSLIDCRFFTAFAIAKYVVDGLLERHFAAYTG